MSARLLSRNEGTADRALRIVLGLVVLSLAFFGPRTAWGYLGILPLVTGIAGSCPVYSLLGISTRRRGGQLRGEAGRSGPATR